MKAKNFHKFFLPLQQKQKTNGFNQDSVWSDSEVG